MSVMDKLGWDWSKQEEIRHKIRNTRESVLHTVAGMYWRPKKDRYYIRIVDRVDFTPYVVATSLPIKTREAQIKFYDQLIKELGLPWCCRVHREEMDGPDDEFGFGEVEEDEDPFGFGGTDDDDLGFEALEEDDDPFGFGADPDEEEFEFDLGTGDEEDEEFVFEI